MRSCESLCLQIHIQRTEGCDHMTCTQCNTNFCYRCGERYRQMRFVFPSFSLLTTLFSCMCVLSLSLLCNLLLLFVWPVVRFFGDHTSNLSVFGCKYRYLPDKPHLRRLIRGSVCGEILQATWPLLPAFHWKLHTCFCCLSPDGPIIYPPSCLLGRLIYFDTSHS